MYLLPFQSNVGPKLKVQHAVKENFYPGELPWAQRAPVMRPHSLSAVNYGLASSFSPCARVRPKAAAVGDKEVGLPGQLVRAQHAVVLLPDPSLCPQPDCNVPPTLCWARRQSERSHCMLRSGLLTWHPSASTADSLLVHTTHYKLTASLPSKGHCGGGE